MITFIIGLIIGLLFGTALTCCVIAGKKGEQDAKNRHGNNDNFNDER